MRLLSSIVFGLRLTGSGLVETEVKLLIVFVVSVIVTEETSSSLLSDMFARLGGVLGLEFVLTSCTRSLFFFDTVLTDCLSRLFFDDSTKVSKTKELTDSGF